VSMMRTPESGDCPHTHMLVITKNHSRCAHTYLIYIAHVLWIAVGKIIARYMEIINQFNWITTILNYRHTMWNFLFYNYCGLLN
jgi:hypothetical protein